MNKTGRSFWHWTKPEPWLRDLRQAARALCRAPAFSLAVFASLAVCIGPNAAIFSALHALVLKPLPFPEPTQLVTVVNVAEKSGGQRIQSSTTQYLDFKARADLFSGFAVIRHSTGTLDDDHAPQRVAYGTVSADFFDVLGVKPLLGRFFSADETVAGRERVVVISHSFWESRFNADARVLGSQVSIDGKPHTVVGVAPRSLAALHNKTGFFLPYAPPVSKLDPQARYRGDLALYGRLKPGVSPGAGLAQLTALEANFLTAQATAQVQAFVATAGYRLAVEPLRAGGATGKTDAWWLLQCGAVLVLLIGCVNVVNLFLALLLAAIGLYGVLSYDVSQRTREIGIRGALGATRGQIVGLVLRQGLWKTGAGLAAGLMGATWLTRGLEAWLFGMGSADAASYAAVIVLLAVVALLASWFPARRAAKVEPMTALRAE